MAGRAIQARLSAALLGLALAACAAGPDPEQALSPPAADPATLTCAELAEQRALLAVALETHGPDGVRQSTKVTSVLVNGFLMIPQAWVDPAVADRERAQDMEKRARELDALALDKDCPA